MAKKNCKAPECGRLSSTRGLCSMHYKRWRYKHNREQILAGNRAYKARNKPAIQKYMQTYYQSNRATYSRNKANYLARHPEQAKERNDRHRNARRAAKAHVLHDPTVTRATLRAQYGDACFYCGIHMMFRARPGMGALPSNYASLEHMTPVSRGGGHTWTNCVLACMGCNSRKGARTDAEWSP